MKLNKIHALLTDKVGEKHITNEGYEIEIIEYFNSNNCTIQFEDGNIRYNLQYYNIKKGEIRNFMHPRVFNVGYEGIGVYNSLIHRKMWDVWHSILGRCYSEEVQKNRPTYKGCSVDENWHNFQVFAEWFEENYNPETMQGWHLDKDILVKGNKIYSPETCCFVPNEINCLFKTEYESSNTFRNRIRVTSQGKYNVRYNSKHVGNFTTYEEALKISKITKENHIKIIAEKWKSLINSQIYELMLKYKV